MLLLLLLVVIAYRYFSYEKFCRVQQVTVNSDKHKLLLICSAVDKFKIIDMANSSGLLFLVTALVVCFLHPIDSLRILRSDNGVFGSARFVGRTQLSVSAPIMPPADLTPAVDKYVRFPASTVIDNSLYTLKAKGPAPDGPDPFNSVSNDLQPLSDYVQELVKSENPVLTMAASHFFKQVRS